LDRVGGEVDSAVGGKIVESGEWREGDLKGLEGLEQRVDKPFVVMALAVSKY
jgi:hypothetical protein